MLCEACLPIFLSAEPIDPKALAQGSCLLSSGVTHLKAEDFELWQEQGCLMCKTLYRNLPSDVQSNISVLDNAGGIADYELFSPSSDGDRVSLVFKFRSAMTLKPGVIGDRSMERLRQGHTLYLHTTLSPYDSSIGYSGLDLGSNTASKRALSIAKEWIVNCRSSHTKCNRKKFGKQFYPTRLIDVGYNPNAPLRLVVRGEDPIEGQYATLSYCRGSESFRKTLTFNLEEMRMSFQADELPKTFKDAVHVTRTLGLRYLWIDALCIIQDSKEDWMREASTMGDVYSNTYCNLAAVHGDDPSKGLSVVRNPFHYNRFSNFTQRPVKDDSPQMYYMSDQCYWSARMNDTPLSYRAWAVQERILSPRTLHFANDMLLMECHETSASEEYPNSIPFGVGRDTSIYIPNNLNNNNTSLGTPQLESHRTIWSDIIRAYTRAKLTDPNDKLIAIAGVARQVSGLVSSPYLAGLWKCSLAADLLWQAKSSGQLIRPTRYRAPSWSWASLDGAVEPSDWATGEELIELIDYQLVPVAQDPFAHLQSGYLRLRGLIYPAQAMIYTGTADVRFGDDFEPEKNRMLLDEKICVPPGRTEAVITVYILSVIQCGQGSTPSRVGLALAPADGFPQGYYRRIGSFQANYPESPGKLLSSCPSTVVDKDWWYEEGRGSEHILCLV